MTHDAIDSEPSVTATLGALFLRSESPWVLIESAKALCRLDASPSIFESVLDSGDRSRRGEAAAWALGQLESPGIVSTLTRALQSPDLPTETRGQAAESLGEQRDPSSFAALAAAAADPQAGVRFWAAFALGVLGDPRAEPILRRLADTDHAEVVGWWSVSREAEESLAHLRSDDS